LSNFFQIGVDRVTGSFIVYISLSFFTCASSNRGRPRLGAGDKGARDSRSPLPLNLGSVPWLHGCGGGVEFVAFLVFLQGWDFHQSPFRVSAVHGLAVVSKRLLGESLRVTALQRPVLG